MKTEGDRPKRPFRGKPQAILPDAVTAGRGGLQGSHQTGKGPFIMRGRQKKHVCREGVSLSGLSFSISTTE